MISPYNAHLLLISASISSIAVGLILVFFRTPKKTPKKRRVAWGENAVEYKEREPQPRRIPSFRNALVKIHSDLFQIQRYVQPRELFHELSELELLVIILEDKRFLNHGGVDLIACCRELVKALLLMRHGGASTIDMQFVRTATGFKERTLRRKLYEMFLAVIIQFRYSKRIILRSYIQCAFFGSHLIGIERASKGIFSKVPQQLNLEESAQLAAMLVYPRPLKPTEAWLIRMRRRASYGQRRMLRLKKSLEKIPR